MTYLWIKSFHIIAITAWMAGLFYLPRLFVYHAVQMRGSEAERMLLVMESRLLRYIMRPAAVATVGSGVMLAYLASFGESDTWFVLKLVGVAGLLGVHGFLEMTLGRFRAGRNARSEYFFRVLNEVPTLLLIWIVIMVVIKPFS